MIFRSFALAKSILIVITATLLAVVPVPLSAQRAKLPKPEVLGRGARFERDPRTGEASMQEVAPSASTPGSPAIRTSVSLVQVGCTVLAPDGTQVRGLQRENFRVLEDGVEQSIAAFDAAATPASIALIIDASPSIYRQLGRMRQAANSLSNSLAVQDEVAVVAFSDTARLLLPFSRDRDLLAAALASQEVSRVQDSTQSRIYEALYLTARELFAQRTGRKAIVLLTDGQDSGLGLTWEPASMHAKPGANSGLAFDDVTKQLAASGIDLYVISTENRPGGMTDAWLASHQNQTLITQQARGMNIPAYTLYLGELVRQTGGRLFFLREMADLADVYRRIAAAIRAEYTLSYYPASGAVRAGWRALRVELRPGGAPTGAQVSYRTTYYVPVSP